MLNVFNQFYNLMIKLIGGLFFTCALVSLSSCSLVNSKNEPIEIDFSETDLSINNEILTDSVPILRVAVAAMISPLETYSYYKELIDYISEKMGYPIEFRTRKTYQEVNALVKTNKVDFAFICSGGYIDLASDAAVEILAVPVVNGISKYQAYIIVNSSSDIKTLEDLKGKTFAFTDPLSNSGKLYTVKRVKELGSTAGNFFSEIIYTYAHDYSIHLVSMGSIDGASVDGLIYDYHIKFSPEVLKDIRIIEKSEYFGIPPVVISRDVEPDIAVQLKKSFFNMDKDSSGIKILEKINIDRFIEGKNSDYNSIRAMKEFIQL